MGQHELHNSICFVIFFLFSLFLLSYLCVPLLRERMLSILLWVCFFFSVALLNEAYFYYFVFVRLCVCVSVFFVAFFSPASSLPKFFIMNVLSNGTNCSTCSTDTFQHNIVYLLYRRETCIIFIYIYIFSVALWMFAHIIFPVFYSFI